MLVLNVRKDISGYTENELPSLRVCALLFWVAIRGPMSHLYYDFEKWLVGVCGRVSVSVCLVRTWQERVK